MTAQAVTGSSLGKSQLWKFAEKKKDAAAQASSQEARSAQQAPAAVAIAGNALRAPDEARSLEELYAYLEELAQAHPGVSFDFLTLEDEAQLRVAAATLGEGAHFLLAPEFIQRMLSGREAFAAGKALLEEAFGRLCKSASQSGLRTGVGVYVAANGQAAQWTAQFSGAARQSQSLGPADWNADARYAGEIRSKQGAVRFGRSKSYKYYAGKDLGRLARLKKIGSVYSFVAGMHAAISQARVKQDLDDNEVRAAIAKMKGVIVRAKVKIKNLQEEETLEKRSRRDAEAAKAERARALAEELRQRRHLRRLREKLQAAGEPFAASERLPRKLSAAQNARQGAAASFSEVAADVAAPFAAETPVGESAAVESVNILA